MSVESEAARCFLCRRKNSANNYVNFIETSTCPASQKNMRDVIDYLARQVDLELHIDAGEWLCQTCHTQIVDYDASLIRVLRKQKRLSQLIVRSLTYVESDLEEECEYHMSTLEELHNDGMLNEVMVPEDEMERIMEEEEAYQRAGRTPSQPSHRGQQGNEKESSFGRPRRSSELLKCSMCAMRFKSKARLQAHTSQAHKKYSCELCDFSHRNEDYVLLHKNVHEGRTENQCRFCDKEFTTKISTIRHMEVHFNNKKYQCDKCGICFSQTTVLYNHKLQHEAEEQPLRCETCQQVFKTKRTYRHHMITHRADRPRHTCEYCAKTFTEKYTLKVHKRIHTDATEVTSSQPEQVEEEIMEEISEIEVTPESLSDTIQTNAKCIICGSSYLTKDELNKHMEKQHDVILKSVSMTNFSTSSFDMETDSGIACHICGHIFNTKTSLDSHLFGVHGISL